MAKITITDLTTLVGAVNDINNKFQQIEDELNNKVLYRNNPVGEANTLQNDIDMNSNDLLNVNNIDATSMSIGGLDVASLAFQANYYVASTQPAELSAGDLWYNLTADKVGYYDGSSVVYFVDILDEFQDIYLGAKSADPTVDNDGDPLTDGDMYFNTTSNLLKVYNSGVWYGFLNNTSEMFVEVDINVSDDNKLIMGDADDLKIYHDSASGNNYIDGNADLYIRPKNLENGIIVEQDGAVSLYHDNALKLQTNSTGVDIFTELDVNRIKNTGSTLAIDSSAQITGASRLSFGNSGSFFLRQDTITNDSYVQNDGSADLIVKSDQIRLEGTSGDYLLNATDNAGVVLYHNALTKAQTTASGFSVNGDIAVTGNVDGVDVSAIPATYVNVSGDTMTGTLTLNADPTSALHAATKSYVDTIAAAGIHYHNPVRVEAPSNLNATYNNGTDGVGATLTNAGTLAAIVIDGIALSAADRVLVYNQTNAAHNGIYTVTTVGDGATAWVLTRSTDTDSYGASDPDALGEGDAFFVKEGDTGAGELYVMNTSGTITFGTTNITFSVIAETAVYTAGTNITLDGTTFNVDDAFVLNTGDTITGDFTLNGGNIVMTGSETVDGRDVSVDGAKLDGIEAGADVTDTANVTAAGALMDSEVTNLAQVKAFNSADYATAAQGTTADSALQNIVEDTTPQLGGDLDGNGFNISVDQGDLISAGGLDITNFSTYNVGVISTDGVTANNLYICPDDTHSVYIRHGTNAIFSYEQMAAFKANAEVELYYDNSLKFETTSTGVSVTGEVNATNVVEAVYNTVTALDPANGGIQYKTLAANTTFTDSLSDGESMTLRLEGGATYTVTYPTMTWISSGGNVAPTLNGTKDTLVFWKENSTLYGAYVGYGA